MWLLVLGVTASADAGLQLREHARHGGHRAPPRSLLHAAEHLAARELFPYIPQAVHPRLHKKVKTHEKDPDAGLTHEQRLEKTLHSFPETDKLEKKLKGLSMYTKQVNQYDHELAKDDRDEDRRLKEAELRRWKAEKAEMAAEAQEDHREGWEEAVEDSHEAEDAEKRGRLQVSAAEAQLRKRMEKQSLAEIPRHKLDIDAFEAPYQKALTHFEDLQANFDRKINRANDENSQDRRVAALDPEERRIHLSVARAKARKRRGHQKRARKPAGLGTDDPRERLPPRESRVDVRARLAHSALVETERPKRSPTRMPLRRRGPGERVGRALVQRREVEPEGDEEHVLGDSDTGLQEFKREMAAVKRKEQEDEKKEDRWLRETAALTPRVPS